MTAGRLVVVARREFYDTINRLADFDPMPARADSREDIKALRSRWRTKAISFWASSAPLYFSNREEIGITQSVDGWSGRNSYWMSDKALRLARLRRDMENSIGRS